MTSAHADRYSFSVVVFDMDGLLLESESKWRQAEEEVSRRLGLGLGQEDFVKTMGVRMSRGLSATAPTVTTFASSSGTPPIVICEACWTG